MLKFSKILIRNEHSILISPNKHCLSNILNKSLSSEANNSDAQDSTNFGYKRVKYEEKQGKVNEVFNNVAEKYDIMNDAMSFGLHRLWKNQFIQDIEPNNQMKLIDVAGGTGNLKATKQTPQIKHSI